MKFDLRSLVLGIALGLIVGVYISPTIEGPKMALPSQIPQPGSASERTIDMPNEVQALKAIFDAQTWDLETQGQGASVTIERCGPSITALVCELTLILPWVSGPTKTQVEFGKIKGQWMARKMRTIQ